MPQPSRASIWAGAMMTAGTAIGAGMFSLPIVSSGMWFTISLLCLALVCFLSYLSAAYILELNLQFEAGASFDTIIKSTLGPNWNTLSGLGIAFLLYILLYAYFSAFGSMVSTTLNLETGSWSQASLGIIFGGLLASIVWFSTGLVSRFSAILVGGMVITFLMSVSGLSLKMETAKLFDLNSNDSNYSTYIWAALPYYITSFGVVTIVPSLYKYYGKQPALINKSLGYGSLIAFLVYALFVTIAFGTISRIDFIDINAAGGNMGTLVAALSGSTDGNVINLALNIFSNFAIITSFLGVGLSLFDYIADKFSFKDDRKGRLYTAVFTFLPAGLASFFFPHGFIAAIGLAGLVVILVFFLLPFFMIRKARLNPKIDGYKVMGGRVVLVGFFIASLAIASCQVLAMLGYLPKW